MTNSGTISHCRPKMDDYTKLCVVGRGAHGVCWLCRISKDPFRQKVIIKSVSTLGLKDKEEKSIMGEVKLLSSLNHPNIIGYIDYFIYDSSVCIVMQYAEGGTLSKFIQDQGERLIDENVALDYFTQITMAVDYLHNKNILHRDLKTQNILMNKRKSVIKLSDFGISKQLNTKSVASTVVGTPNYLSPEICEGRSYNQKSDMWSLGCVLYELMHLRRAFEAETMLAVIMKITKGACSPYGSHLSPGINRMIQELLKIDDKERPDTKTVLTDELILPVCMKITLSLGRITKPITSCNFETKAASDLTGNLSKESTLSNKSAALRLDVPNSSDAIKGSMGFSEGFHIFQINWRVENRDNNSVVGIGTENAILHADGSNVPLIGVDAESYGWNIGTGKLANSFVKDRIFPSWYYEDEDTYRAPYVFYCLLNLDIGYMAFVDNDYFLGFAAVGLSGKTWYPLATTGFPTAHVGITYLGGIKRKFGYS
uniref:Protein kinase domain-containing protein n=1 Tax=Rhabditophanes sp. KR3021 TaxID=114890 RepID=A0AC35TZZ8_9BILA